MSVLPSPLKSPLPMTNQSMVTDPGDPPPMTLAPSISQTTTCPVRLLYQMMSALPSLLTSPVPRTNHPMPGVTEPTKPPPITVVPFNSHITTCPVVVLC